MNLDVFFPSPEDIQGWKSKTYSKPSPSYFSRESSWLNTLFQIRFLIMQRCDRVNNITAAVDEKKRAISISFELERLGYFVSLKEVNSSMYHIHISWGDEDSEDDGDVE